MITKRRYKHFKVKASKRRYKSNRKAKRVHLRKQQVHRDGHGEDTALGG